MPLIWVLVKKLCVIGRGTTRGFSWYPFCPSLHLTSGVMDFCPLWSRRKTLCNATTRRWCHLEHLRLQVHYSAAGWRHWSQSKTQTRHEPTRGLKTVSLHVVSGHVKVSLRSGSPVLVPSPRVPSPGFAPVVPIQQNCQRQSNTHCISLSVLPINIQLHAYRSDTSQLNHTKYIQHNPHLQLSYLLPHV
jgi:hypothetical protein